MVKLLLGKWHSSSQQTCKIGVLLCRLRFLLSDDDPPQWEHCGGSLTVLNILCVCPALGKLRRKYFSHFYRNRIPFHPALVLGEESLISFERFSEII